MADQTWTDETVVVSLNVGSGISNGIISSDNFGVIYYVSASFENRYQIFALNSNLLSWNSAGSSFDYYFDFALSIANIVNGVPIYFYPWAIYSGSNVGSINTISNTHHYPNYRLECISTSTSTFDLKLQYWNGSSLILDRTILSALSENVYYGVNITFDTSVGNGRFIIDIFNKTTNVQICHYTYDLLTTINFTKTYEFSTLYLTSSTSSASATTRYFEKRTATKIEDTYYDELQDAVNAWQTAYGLTNSTWTQDEPDTDDSILEVTTLELETAIEYLEFLAGKTSSLYKISGTKTNSNLDLTTFTEVDPDGILTIASNSLTATGSSSANENYVYKDFGVGYFNNFCIDFKINASFFNLGAYALGFTNDNSSDIRSVSGTYIGLSFWSGLGSAGMLQYTTAHRINLNLNTDYYVRFIKIDSFSTYGQIFCFVYSDSRYNTLVNYFTAYLTEPYGISYRYLYIYSDVNGIGTNTQFVSSDYKIRNLNSIDFHDLELLRYKVNLLQSTYCYLCDTCDTETCDCNPACNVDGCDCDGICDTDTCTCHGTCNSDGCTCHGLCNGDTCTNCNASCYSYSKVCVLCYFSCYSDACTCNGSCNGDSCTCHGECNSDSCTCNSGCDNDVCSVCNGSCNVEGCTKCDGTAYRYPWT